METSSSFLLCVWKGQEIARHTPVTGVRSRWVFLWKPGEVACSVYLLGCLGTLIEKRRCAYWQTRHAQDARQPIFRALSYNKQKNSQQGKCSRDDQFVSRVSVSREAL